MMEEKLQLSLTAGLQQEAVGTISFHFCGSQFHAIAISRWVWAFRSMQSDWLHWWRSHKMMRRERRWQTEFKAPSLSLCSGFLDLFQNNKCCFPSCPALRKGREMLSCMRKETGEGFRAWGELKGIKTSCQLWNKSPPLVENLKFLPCFLCVPF